jgi:hypothetical protein
MAVPPPPQRLLPAPSSSLVCDTPYQLYRQTKKNQLLRRISFGHCSWLPRSSALYLQFRLRPFGNSRVARDIGPYRQTGKFLQCCSVLQAPCSLLSIRAHPRFNPLVSKIRTPKSAFRNCKRGRHP